MTKRKYNGKQMIIHANTARGESEPFKPNRIGKGKLVETENDIILKMEHDYGGIKTEREYDESIDDFVRQLVCATCGHIETEKMLLKDI